ncbi:hypothetical protein [Terriglobus aquaticus]|uniref:Uncharacterized protein n=1 Tax=Terriglobus aquaticus TaxID=940139 RepID=A0ABW9KH74_9BACT|nr:hypothetical protein [Terriglobus aquaticus]
MFDTHDALRNPPMSRAQKLYTSCFCSGLLLNGISTFSAPHHAHQSIWITINLIALTLMIVGVVTGGAHMLRQRALKRQSRFQAENRSSSR